MKRLLAGFLAALVFGLTACSTLTPWAAKVNGDLIEVSALDQELDAILANQRYLQQVQSANLAGGVTGQGEGTFTTAFVGRILTRQIFFELIRQEVERRKIEISAAEEEAAAADVIASFGEPEIFRAFPEDYRQELIRRQAEVTALQAALGEVEVDEASVAKFYEENRALFAQTCVSHILVGTQEEAAALKAQIAGGADFAELARQNSIDPGSGPNGGDLGCVQPGSFVPEFETVMETLPEGQVSEPTQTQFGWHLLLVTDRSPRPLEEARAEIRQRLLSESQSDFEGFVDRALAEADIEVNPRYGTFDRDSAQPGIIPPTAPTPDPTVAPELPTGEAPPLGVPQEQPVPEQQPGAEPPPAG